MAETKTVYLPDRGPVAVSLDEWEYLVGGIAHEVDPIDPPLRDQQSGQGEPAEFVVDVYARAAATWWSGTTSVSDRHQHRHGYAAGLHRGLPVGDINRPKSHRTQQLLCGCALLRGPNPPGSSRWVS